MTPAQLTNAIDPRSHGVVAYCDQGFGRAIPESDADVALIELPNGTHINVSWDDDIQRFCVVLYRDEFDTVVARHEVATYDDVVDSVRELSLVASVQDTPITPVATLAFDKPLNATAGLPSGSPSESPTIKIGVQPNPLP